MYQGFFWRTGHHKRKLKLEEIKAGKTKREEIHYSLMNKLGMASLLEGETQAFLNLSSINMIGERWKPMPAYEDRYQISNFGRVKSLKRISQGQRSKVLSEKIMRLMTLNSVSKKKDGTEISNMLYVLLHEKGKLRYFMVARLVYLLFVESFDINDFHNYIHYKDGNALNIRPENLIASDKIFRNGL